MIVEKYLRIKKVCIKQIQLAKYYNLFVDTNRFKQGLICGRFYPYHKGHRFLIQSALEQSDKVFVVVCDRREQAIPAKRRAEWIRESFLGHQQKDDLHIAVFDQDQAGLADRDPDGWADAIWTVMREYGIERADAVFANESYKQRFAELLEAQLVPVDPGRITYPISATQIRTQPEQNNEFLEPHVLADIRHMHLPHDHG